MRSKYPRLRSSKQSYTRRDRVRYLLLCLVLLLLSGLGLLGWTRLTLIKKNNKLIFGINHPQNLWIWKALTNNCTRIFRFLPLIFPPRPPPPPTTHFSKKLKRNLLNTFEIKLRKSIDLQVIKKSFNYLFPWRDPSPNVPLRCRST